MTQIKTLSYTTADKETIPAIVHLRKDFYSLFNKELKNFFEESNCNYFAHTIIKNYRKEDYVISSFNSKEDWLELYWEKYKDDDPIERSNHRNVLLNNIGLSSWQIVDPSSECAEARRNTCDTKDGFTLAYTHPNNVIENISFGWKSLRNKDFDMEKVFKLTNMIKPLRQYHYDNPNF